MKLTISDIRETIRNEIHSMLNEIVSKEVPNGTAWKLGGGKNGWAAKNKNGVTNHWYGEDEVKNKEKADAFRNDSSRKPDTKTEARIMKLSSAKLGKYVREITSGRPTKSSDPFANSNKYYWSSKPVGGKSKKKTNKWKTPGGKTAIRNADGSVSYEEK